MSDVLAAAVLVVLWLIPLAGVITSLTLQWIVRRDLVLGVPAPDSVRAARRENH